MANTPRSLEARLTGGRPNSLGEANTIVDEVLAGDSDLAELYGCLFSDDQWVRMRAGDALEKVCRQRPEWFADYLERLLSEVAAIRQPSVQWHLAQMLGEIELTQAQQQRAIEILRDNLTDPNVDWIVASNSMETLAQFARDGSVPVEIAAPLIEQQLHHRSKAVVKRATKLLADLP